MTSTVIFVDGVTYLITARRRSGFEARRLTPSEEERALRQLDDAHADLEAAFVGFRG